MSHVAIGRWTIVDLVDTEKFGKRAKDMQV